MNNNEAHVKLKKILIEKIINMGKEKTRFYSFSFLVVGLLTSVLGSHLINAYKGKDKFLNLNEDYENMLGV